jgi:hypothetical protein
MGFKCDLVIAYYKEDLSWLHEFKHLPFRKIFLYTKGKTSPEAPVSYIEEKLDNIEEKCPINYTELIPQLILSIKELKQEVDKIKSNIYDKKNIYY